MASPKIVIVGAGPTGLGAAWRLHEKGHVDWLLFEAEEKAGGLAGSVIDPQGFTWDMGGHVLFSHYPTFDALMQELLGDQWITHQRQAWVHMRGGFIPYPLQLHLWKLPPIERFRCLGGLLVSKAMGHSKRASPNFRRWLSNHFGTGLATAFLYPYNEKVWAYPLEQLDAAWMSERVATVSLSRLLSNWLCHHEEVAWGPNATFRFPKRGGTGAIWSTLADRLPREKLHFKKSVVHVNSAKKTVVLRDGQEHPYDFLISTLPLDRLVSVMNRPDLQKFATPFLHSSTRLLGLGLEGQIPESLSKKNWIYFPEPEIPFYRATLFSNYSPQNVPDPKRHWSILCEGSESSAKPGLGDAFAKRGEEALRKAGLIPSSSKTCSLWTHYLPYGYPTPFLGRAQTLRDLNAVLEGLGIWSRGRFGAWKYEVSNQDHSLMQGVEAVDHLLEGKTEMTYHTPERVNAAR